MIEYNVILTSIFNSIYKIAISSSWKIVYNKLFRLTNGFLQLFIDAIGLGYILNKYNAIARLINS